MCLPPDWRDKATPEQLELLGPKHFHREMYPNSSASHVVAVPWRIEDCKSHYCKEVITTNRDALYADPEKAKDLLS